MSVPVRYILPLLVGLTVISGCSTARNLVSGDPEVSFEGIRHKANLSPDTSRGRDFVVTVSPFAVNPGAALEAGRYEATKYCLKQYGGSDASWTVGPDDDPAGFRPVNDTITLDGRCTQS